MGGMRYHAWYGIPYAQHVTRLNRALRCQVLDTSGSAYDASQCHGTGALADRVCVAGRVYLTHGVVLVVKDRRVQREPVMRNMHYILKITARIRATDIVSDAV